MSEQEEFKIEVFEDFIGLYVSPFRETPTEGYTLDDMQHSFNAGMETCAERKDKEIARREIIIKLHASIIEQQAAELAALRGFANALIKNSDVMYRYYVHVSARKYGLHDEQGKPTKLLTGEE